MMWLGQSFTSKRRMSYLHSSPRHCVLHFSTAFYAGWSCVSGQVLLPLVFAIRCQLFLYSVLLLLHLWYTPW